MKKMQLHSLYTLAKEWFGDSPWKIKQDSAKKTKLNFSVIAVRKINNPHLIFFSIVINKFPALLVLEII